MSLKEVLIHVPGDREAVVEYLNKHKIKYKMKGNTLWIENTLIYIDKYGSSSARLCLYTQHVPDNEGKPLTGNCGYGECCLPLREQVKLFDKLKAAITKQRKEHFKQVEEDMANEKKAREEDLAEIQTVINFESGVLRVERKFDDQIKRTRAFIFKMQIYMSEATFAATRADFAYNPTQEQIDGTKPEDLPRGRIDCGALNHHIDQLNDLLKYLEDEEIEAVHILNDTKEPVKVKKKNVEKKLRIQKGHLKKLSSKTNRFVKDIKWFCGSGIRGLQITTPMRKHLKDDYERILAVFEWYAEFFKRTIRGM